MNISMYQASVPLMRRALVNLRDCVAKGAAHFQADGKPESALLEARLAPDMFTFTQQIRTCCRTAERAAALLSGMPVPAGAEDEASIGQLLARIDGAIAQLDGASADIVNGRAGHEVVVVPVPDMAIHFADGGEAGKITFQ